MNSPNPHANPSVNSHASPSANPHTYPRANTPLVTKLQPGGWKLSAGITLLRRKDIETLNNAATLERHARARGWRHGQARALREAAKRRAIFTARAVQWVSQLEKALTLALADAASRIIGAIEPNEAMAKAVQTALRRRGAMANMILRVAPEQEEGVRNRLLAMGADANGFARVEADERLQPGDGALESPLGVIHIGPKAQLAALSEALQALAPERQDPPNSDDHNQPNNLNANSTENPTL